MTVDVLAKFAKRDLDNTSPFPIRGRYLSPCSRGHDRGSPTGVHKRCTGRASTAHYQPERVGLAGRQLVEIMDLSGLGSTGRTVSATLKPPWPSGRAGSNPAPGTDKSTVSSRLTNVRSGTSARKVHRLFLGRPFSRCLFGSGRGFVRVRRRTMLSPYDYSDSMSPNRDRDELSSYEDRCSCRTVV